ncbi:hypothetical protein HY629_00605 [Candidatus Uhrbacteria bacterium]|nr:hypothetical protein [Candidatus Uhrbacteria bacterium]
MFNVQYHMSGVRGQGLLETTIAIGILSVGVLSILSLGASQLKAIRAAEDRLVAGELAREGMEIVRSVRDSNWLAGGTTLWTQGWAADGPYYRIPSIAPDHGVGNVRWSLLGLPSGEFTLPGATVYTDGIFYRQALTIEPTWKRTQFKRIITVTPVAADPVNARRVVVDVRWGNLVAPSKVVVEEVLWNWK